MYNTRHLMAWTPRGEDVVERRWRFVWCIVDELVSEAMLLVVYRMAGSLVWIRLVYLVV